MKVDVVVGLQYGSEGKGRVVIEMLARHHYDAAVRVGGPNAGHTIYHEGRKFVMHSLPCAWVDPECELFIGAGGVVNLDVLAAELTEVEAVMPNIRSRVTVDPHAAVIRNDHCEVERVTLVAIGSTLQGVGEAQISKIRRHGLPLVGHREISDLGVRIARVTDRLWGKDDVVIEGTQGAMLSLDHGWWPHVTSRNTTAAQLISDTGLPPTSVRYVVGVARTHPIRVGGPSGPLNQEISWADLSKTLGREVAPEITSVTKRQRRIGLFSLDEYTYAVRLNGCTHIFITFMDYLLPEARQPFLASLTTMRAPVLCGFSYGEQRESTAWNGGLSWE